MPSKKKLSRSKARELDVKEIVHEIEQPKAPLALRLSAMLMRGVVQLYSTQVKFLEIDSKDFVHRFNQSLHEGDEIRKRGRKRSAADVDDTGSESTAFTATSHADTIDEHQAKRGQITHSRVTLAHNVPPMPGEEMVPLLFNESDSFALLDSQAFTAGSSPSDSHQRARAAPSRGSSDLQGPDIGAEAGAGSSSGDEDIHLPPAALEPGDEMLPAQPLPLEKEDELPPPPPPAADEELPSTGGQAHGQVDTDAGLQIGQDDVDRSYKFGQGQRHQKKTRRRRMTVLAKDSEKSLSDATYADWVSNATELTITRTLKRSRQSTAQELMQDPLLLNDTVEEIRQTAILPQPSLYGQEEVQEQQLSSAMDEDLPAAPQATEAAEEPPAQPLPPPEEEPERMREAQSSPSSQERRGQESSAQDLQAESGSSEQEALGFASSGSSSHEQKPTGPLADALFGIQGTQDETALPHLPPDVSTGPIRSHSQPRDGNTSELVEESAPRTQRDSQLAPLQEDSRTAAIRHFLQHEFSKQGGRDATLSLQALITEHRLGRLGGASLFFHVLALTSIEAIIAEQAAPYADIKISRSSSSAGA